MLKTTSTKAMVGTELSLFAADGSPGVPKSTRPTKSLLPANICREIPELKQ